MIPIILNPPKYLAFDPYSKTDFAGQHHEPWESGGESSLRHVGNRENSTNSGHFNQLHKISQDMSRCHWNCTKGAGTDQLGSKSLSQVIHLRCRECTTGRQPNTVGGNGFQQWRSLSASILHAGLAENRIKWVTPKFDRIRNLRSLSCWFLMFLRQNHWHLHWASSPSPQPSAEPRIQPAPGASPPGRSWTAKTNTQVLVTMAERKPLKHLET